MWFSKPDQTPEAIFVLEPEPILESDQVWDPAQASIIEGVLVEFGGMEWSPAHPPATEVSVLTPPQPSDPSWLHAHTVTGPSSFGLRQTPSFLWHHLGPLLLWLRIGFLVLRVHLDSPPLWLRQAPPSLHNGSAIVLTTLWSLGYVHLLLI